MVADFLTKPLQGSQFVKLRDEIMNANPHCLDYSFEDCRSVLNVATTTGGQTKVSGNETEWITVESKKAVRQAKRIESRTSSAETGNDHGNGEAKFKQVNFVGE